MSNPRKFLLITILVLTSQGSYCQIGLSNFSLLSTNPANTTLTKNIDISLLSESQHYYSNLSIKTISLTIVDPLYHKKVKDDDIWGALGFNFIDNRSNINTYLIKQHVNGSLSLKFDLSNFGNLSIGFTSGITQIRSATSEYTTGNQYIPTIGFDPSQPTGEASNEQKLTYFKVDAGARWSLKNNLDDEKVFISFSIGNLNRPNNSVTGSLERVPFDYYGQIGLSAVRNEKFQLSPQFIFQRQNRLDHYSLGAIGVIQFRNSNPFDLIGSGSIKVHTFINSVKSIELGFTLLQPEYELGFSYSTFRHTNEPNLSKPVFEIGIKIKINKKKRINTVLTPTSLDEVRTFFDNKEKDSKIDTTHSESSLVSISEMSKIKFELRKQFSFDFNEYNLTDEMKFFLNDIVDLLFQHSNLYLKAIGHSDNIGTRKANEVISKKRAQSVLDYLIESGIAPRRMRALGKGDREPINSNDTIEEQAKNRRVEIIISFEGY